MTSRIPEPLRTQLTQGRPLAAELDAPPGRRAFVIVRSEGGASNLRDSLRGASAKGAIPKAHGFSVIHAEYDNDVLETMDYDVGMTRHAHAHVQTIEEVEATVTAWGFDHEILQPYWKTDAP